MNQQQDKVVMARIVDNTQPRKDHEEKRYLVCIEEHTGEKDWAILIGRTATYEWIKERIEFINFEESFVLVETLVLSERKPLYAYMKYVQDFYEDSFDIDDYIRGDFDEQDFMQRSNGEDPSNDVMEAIQNRNGINATMAMMNGEANTIPLN